MIRQGRDELICDLAETYRIYSLQGLPATLLATLAVGLREDSRIKMLMHGEKYSLRDLVAVASLDQLSLLVWAQSEDARKGRNPPRSLLSVILDDEDTGKLETFQEAEDFEDAWASITGVSHGW